MEILSAYYDGGTDEIKGCKKFSPSWWHERGHQVLRRNKYYGAFMNVHMTLLIFAGVVMLAEPYSPSWWIFMVVIAIMFADELFAWVFAYANKEKWIRYKKKDWER